MTARRWTALLLSVGTALALAAACSGGDGDADWRKRCATDGAVLRCAPGDRPDPPKLTGDLLDGGRYDATADRGQVMVINFWGSWCAPCRAEADDLERTYQGTKATGVRFLGVNVQDSRDKARAFEEGRVTYPSLFDPSAKLALTFEVPPSRIPSTIVLDREGRIAAVITGAVVADKLAPVVTGIAAEAPPPAGAR